MPASKEKPDKRPANLVHAAKLQQAEDRRNAVLAHKDEIFEMFMDGHGFKTICERLDIKESPQYVRQTLQVYARKEYIPATLSRAHSMVEEALETARLGKSLGDAAGLRLTVDTLLKVAGKIAPGEYGEKSKVEHTGADGGPIKMLAANMSDEQLAKIASGGDPEDGQ